MSDQEIKLLMKDILVHIGYDFDRCDEFNICVLGKELIEIFHKHMKDKVILNIKDNHTIEPRSFDGLDIQ